MSIQVGTKLTQREVEQIDALIKKGIGLNRSDILRQAIRDFLEQNETFLKKEESNVLAKIS